MQYTWTTNSITMNLKTVGAGNQINTIFGLNVTPPELINAESWVLNSTIICSFSSCMEPCMSFLLNCSDALLIFYADSCAFLCGIQKDITETLFVLLWSRTETSLQVLGILIQASGTNFFYSLLSDCVVSALLAQIFSPCSEGSFHG